MKLVLLTKEYPELNEEIKKYMICLCMNHM